MLTHLGRWEEEGVAVALRDFAGDENFACARNAVRRGRIALFAFACVLFDFVFCFAITQHPHAAAAAAFCCLLVFAAPIRFTTLSYGFRLLIICLPIDKPRVSRLYSWRTKDLRGAAPSAICAGRAQVCEAYVLEAPSSYRVFRRGSFACGPWSTHTHTRSCVLSGCRWVGKL